MKNLIVGQSGGPTAVINSSLYGVIREGFNRSEEIEHVYGMINGIQGFLDGRFMDMKELDNDTLEALRTTPGAYLGSCRFKLPDDLNDAIYPLLFQKFEEMNIGYFFYIGGNDSMDTVSKLSRYAAAHNIDVRIMGIPKTIDNDLILTDHTPGFGSAAKYVAASVCEIGLDASVYNTKSVTIIEIMGRHAGWLTAASVLARKFEQMYRYRMEYLKEPGTHKLLLKEHEAIYSALKKHDKAKAGSAIRIHIENQRRSIISSLRDAGRITEQV